MTTPPIVYPPVDPNPTRQETVLAGVYEPRRKGSYLSAMQRSLKASPLNLLHAIQGAVLHRLLSIMAESQEDQDFRVADVLALSIREANYRAWTQTGVFERRTLPTMARGLILLSALHPLAQDDLIHQGDLFATADGRVVGAIQDTVFPAGNSQLTLYVVSQAVGQAGNIPSGAITRMLGNRFNYGVTNVTAIAGGRDAETDAQIRVRFQDFVNSRATGNQLAVYSAARNARVAGEAVSDAALVAPWRLDHSNSEMSLGYVFIDAGYGTASSALVGVAQAAVDLVESAGQKHVTVAASPWVVALTVSVQTTRTASINDVNTALTQAWTDITAPLLIEDGRGRGALDTYDLKTKFDKCHPDIVTVTLTVSGILTPPIGSRLVAGLLTANIGRGETFRP